MLINTSFKKKKGFLFLILWLLVILGSLSIYTVPITPTFNFAPIESIYILNNLPLVAIAFHLWLILVLFLLILSQHETNKNLPIHTFFVSLIFIITFVGFWLTLTRGQLHSFMVMADIRTFIEQGYFSSIDLNYGGFPGAAILGLSVQQITGLEIPELIYLLAFFKMILFCVFLYVLFRILLKNLGATSLAIMLTVLSSIALYTTLLDFDARTFAVNLLVPVSLIIVLKNELFRSWGGRGILILMLATLTITHFPSAVFIWLILLGMFLVELHIKNKLITPSLLGLAGVFIIGWQVNTPFGMLHGFVGLVDKIIQDFLEGNLLVRWILPLQTGYFQAEANPLWATIVWRFWPILLVVFGFILGIKNLLKVKELAISQLLVLGGLIGIVFFAVIALFLDGIEGAFNRTLMYAPLFTVPIVISFFAKNKFLLHTLLALVVILSFATFLAYNFKISQWMVHEPEWAAGRFLERAHEARGKGLYLYGITELRFIIYNLPDMSDERIGYAQWRGLPEDKLWWELNKVVTDFKFLTSDANLHVLEVSRRWESPFRRFIGIDPKTSNHWAQLRIELSQGNKIYDNGFSELYLGQGGRNIR
ncbi:hypothetical protein M1N08_01090 [Dehalococcoidia bacterium]|nr:hypothetical protein [Dehalococcoidia bacterium]